MPALTVLGQRLVFLADDDLRVVALGAFKMRFLQLILLVPSFILLLQVDLVEDDYDDCNGNNRNDSNSLNGRSIDGGSSSKASKEEIIAWSFWALSALSFVLSLVLESFIFNISSRGSPVQTERRKALPCLCATKIVPLGLIRLAAVVLAFQMVGTRDFCINNQHPRNIGGGCPGRDEVADAFRTVCRRGTKTALFLLAVTHILEAGVTLLLASTMVIRVLCAHGRKRHLQFQQCLSLYNCKLLTRIQGRSNGISNSNTDSGSGWHSFCQFCCLLTCLCTCCCFGGSGVAKKSCRSEQSSSCLADVSLVLADFFDSGVGDEDEGFLDVTPSDILVGLSVLASEQRLQKREQIKQLEQQNAPLAEDFDVEIGKDVGPAAVVSSISLAKGFVDLEDNEPYYDDDSHNGNSQDSSNASSLDLNKRRGRRRTGFVQTIRLVRDDSEATAQFTAYERKRLVKEDEFDRLAIADGAHYMRLALAVYGHMMYFKTNTCTAPCDLLAGVLICRACRSRNDRPTVIGDNLCRLNELSLLGVAELKVEDVIYCSFKSGIEKCPYAIVVDRPKKSIVIAIRGTLSLEAAAADLSIRPELLENFRDRCEGLNDPSLSGEFCHSGMLKCALRIYNDLKRHRHLESLLTAKDARFPEFQLVCTGHSLGAGVAAVLGLLLKGEVPILRCLCFAPPGCVLSEGAASQDFITSYVLGLDIVPRLSLHSMECLRDDVLRMIARIKVPKHEAFRDSRRLVLAAKDEKQPVSINSLAAVAHAKGDIPDSSFYDQVYKFKQRQQKLKMQRELEDVKLFPPGRIVHLVESCLRGGESGYFEFLRQGETVRYTPVWASPSDFSEIQVSRTLLDDHYPDNYLLHLNNIAESFAEPEKALK